MVEREIVKQDENQRYGLGENRPYRQHMAERKLDHKCQRCTTERSKLEAQAACKPCSLVTCKVTKGKKVIERKVCHDRNFGGKY